MPNKLNELVYHAIFSLQTGYCISKEILICVSCLHISKPPSNLDTLRLYTSLQKLLWGEEQGVLVTFAEIRLCFYVPHWGQSPYNPSALREIQSALQREISHSFSPLHRNGDHDKKSNQRTYKLGQQMLLLLLHSV